MRPMRTALLLTFLWIVAAAAIPNAPKVGHLFLHVRGNLQDVILLDSYGHLDRVNDSVAVANIPGCTRWPGGVSADEDDTSGITKPEREDTVFELRVDHYGRYVVSAQANARVAIEIEANYEAMDGSDTSCPGVVTRDSVGHSRKAWAVDVRRGMPKGKCAVRIVRLSKFDLEASHPGK